VREVSYVYYLKEDLKEECLELMQNRDIKDKYIIARLNCSRATFYRSVKGILIKSLDMQNLNIYVEQLYIKDRLNNLVLKNNLIYLAST
jgi:hypothetical protein